MKNLLAATLGLLLAACGTPSTDSAAGHAAAPRAAAAPAAANTLAVQLEGALSGSLEGHAAVAGARYGRYHLNLGGSLEGRPVVVALASANTAAPGAGTYPLGADQRFAGTVEATAEDLTFAIESGELVIESAEGDVLRGHFNLKAVEMAGEATLQATGRFHTKAAN